MKGYIGAEKFSRELGISKGVLYKAIKILQLDNSNGYSGYTEAQKKMILNCDCVKTYLENKKLREEQKFRMQEERRKFEQELFEKANNQVETQNCIRRQSNLLCSKLDKLNRNIELFIDLFRYINGINYEKYEDFEYWRGEEDNQDDDPWE